MSAEVDTLPSPRELRGRILIVGSDILADALASALKTDGFTTMSVEFSASDSRGGIDWRPDLAVIDARPLDVSAGTSLIGTFRQADIEVCVIDAVEDVRRLVAWRTAGCATLIDKREPFDQLFKTIRLLLRHRLTASDSRGRAVPSWTPRQTDDGRRRRLAPFLTLTERERVVLAELIEGHCAEDIANAGFVSISTVRSQIKAILQKLGVNSQLAAVAMARRTGWSLEWASELPPEPANNRRRRVS